MNGGQIVTLISSGVAIISAIGVLVGMMRAKLKEAEEKGIREEQMKNMKVGIDAAHEKIRKLQDGHTVLSSELLRMDGRLGNIENLLAEVKQGVGELTRMHMSEGRDGR